MHLGARVSALLDGRLPAAEEDRAWAHVHECHPCRDLVEREGWVKTQLAGLSLADRTDRTTPPRLKDSLLAPCSLASSSLASGSLAPGSVRPGRPSSLAPSPFATAVTAARRHRSLVALGGGAAGAAVVGVLVLGAAGAPQLERRVPVSDLTPPTPSLSPTPTVLEGGDDDTSEVAWRHQSGQHDKPAVTSVMGAATHVEVVRQAPRVTMAP